MHKYFEFAVPQRITCTSKQQYMELLGRNIKHRNCYRSLYKFKLLKKVNGKTQGYDTALIDKLYFDTDSDMAREKIIDMHEVLLKDDTLHSINLTGRGFALYVYCEPYEATYPSDTLYNAQIHLIDRCKFELDSDASISDIDISCLGNTSKVSRIVGSFNFNWYKRTKMPIFCTSIPHELLYTSMDNIREYAKCQRTSVHFYGTNRISLKAFDYPVKSYKKLGRKTLHGNTPKIDSIPEDTLLDCVRAVMCKKNPSHMERVMLVAELSYIFRLGGLYEKSDELIDSIIDVIRKCKFIDFDERRTRYQVGVVVEKQDSAFSCRWKRKHHMCKECN